MRFFEVNLMPASLCTSVVLDSLANSVLRKCVMHRLIQVYQTRGVDSSRNFLAQCTDFFCCTVVLLHRYHSTFGCTRS